MENLKLIRNCILNVTITDPFAYRLVSVPADAVAIDAFRQFVAGGVDVVGERPESGAG